MAASSSFLTNDRVPGTLRNEFSTPAFWQLDLRVGRTIRFGERYRLTLLAEGFNIFNRSNVQAVFNSPYTLNAAGSGLPPRSCSATRRLAPAAGA